MEISTTNLWRLHIKQEIHVKVLDRCRFCIDGGFVGVGWAALRIPLPEEVMEWAEYSSSKPNEKFFASTTMFGAETWSGPVTVRANTSWDGYRVSGNTDTARATLMPIFITYGNVNGGR
jgi:hypothetical protein